MIFRVVSSSPLPEAQRIDVMHFDSELANCQSSDSIPGGFGGLTLSYNLVMQPEVTNELGTPTNFADLGHIQLFAGDERGFLCFEGRVEAMDSPNGRQATAVTATGYGIGDMAATNDMWFSSPAFQGESEIGGGQLLREVLTAAAPLIKLGDKDQFYEPGGRYLRSGQDGRYPSQTIDEVVKAGDSNNNQVVFAVYEDRVALLYPRVPPVDGATGEIIADYYVPFDRSHVTWHRDGKMMIGAVAVQFRDPTSNTTNNTEVSAEQEQRNFRDANGGILRGYLVANSNWTQAQAEFYRDSYLKRYKDPVITCMVNSDQNTWPVYNRLGGVVPFYMVRSGQWIQIGAESPIMINSTRKDYKKMTCAIVASNVS